MEFSTLFFILEHSLLKSIANYFVFMEILIIDEVQTQS